ncbi:hypothetical protein KIL84_003542 [Mauremys mutica]|uniref:Uncharacterized protein n=1 Tax=Mauremys mutica TaxID=74926 RepID=A0A9D4ARK4_9SAUR|nr:hypothetical protein KIL84_003542 [Mauremys mutica]
MEGVRGDWGIVGVPKRIVTEWRCTQLNWNPYTLSQSAVYVQLLPAEAKSALLAAVEGGRKGKSITPLLFGESSASGGTNFMKSLNFPLGLWLIPAQGQIEDTKKHHLLLVGLCRNSHNLICYVKI